jgi:hypothetical protein
MIEMTRFLTMALFVLPAIIGAFIGLTFFRRKLVGVLTVSGLALALGWLAVLYMVLVLN